MAGPWTHQRRWWSGERLWSWFVCDYVQSAWWSWYCRWVTLNRLVLCVVKWWKRYVYLCVVKWWKRYVYLCDVKWWNVYLFFRFNDYNNDNVYSCMMIMIQMIIVWIIVKIIRMRILIVIITTMIIIITSNN